MNKNECPLCKSILNSQLLYFPDLNVSYVSDTEAESNDDANTKSDLSDEWFARINEIANKKPKGSL